MEQTLESALAVVRAEQAVGEVVAARAAWPGDGVRRESDAHAALRAASALAAEGKRAAVLLSPRELLGALDAVEAASLARIAVVVHVASDDARLGRQDLPAALSSGAGVLATWSAADAVDAVLALRRAAEDSETPFVHLVGADAARRTVELPDGALVTQFLGARGPSHSAAAADPVALKRAERSFAARVPFALASAMRDLAERTGRPFAALERYELTDAEEVLVAAGTAFAPARAVARAAREAGKRIGVLGIRALRPFYAADVVKALGRARAIVVLDPLDVALAPAGPLATDVKAAFADALTWAPGYPGVGHIPPIVSAVFATGGVAEGDVRAALDELAAGDRARRVLVFGGD